MNKLIDLFPEIAKEWHPTKNVYDLSLISYGSAKEAWWLCPVGHEYQMRVNSRTGKHKCGCPYCNSNRKTGSLAETHPELASQWHPKNLKSPSEVTAGTHTKVWWFGSCGHEWEMPINNRTNPGLLSGCPYCANRLVDDTNSLLGRCPEIAKEWHPTKNGDLTPDKVNYRCYKRVWWLGECGHEWDTLVRTRTRVVRPAGCPYCRDSKGEKKVEETLIKLGLYYEKQVRFHDCRDKRSLPFDFKVDNILIEYQGIQHYEPVNFGNKDYIKVFEETKKRDAIKYAWCNEKGYDILVISYKDFNNIPKIIERAVGRAPTDRRGPS